MTNKELEKRFSEIDKQQKRNCEHTYAVDRHLAFLQKEWEVYEDAYKDYARKHYGLRNRIYAIAYRIKRGKWPTLECRVARRMARIFDNNSG